MIMNAQVSEKNANYLSVHFYKKHNYLTGGNADVKRIPTQFLCYLILSFKRQLMAFPTLNPPHSLEIY